MGVPGPTKDAQISFSKNRLASNQVSLKKDILYHKGCASMGKAHAGVLYVELSPDSGGNDERRFRRSDVSVAA